jgi:hypothetical protein
LPLIFSEPVISNTVSTLTRRREPKRREVCESELKELLAPLFPFVRFPHVLPRDKSSEVLDMVKDSISIYDETFHIRIIGYPILNSPIGLEFENQCRILKDILKILHPFCYFKSDHTHFQTFYLNSTLLIANYFWSNRYDPETSIQSCPTLQVR